MESAARIETYFWNVAASLPEGELWARAASARPAQAEARARTVDLMNLLALRGIPIPI
jgi:hypothetical protein